MLKKTIQDNKILLYLNLEFIVLFNVLICAEKMNDIVLRKSLIYMTQYKETLHVGFFFIFALEFIVNLVLHKSFRKAILSIRFVKEANKNCNSRVYLLKRPKNNWKHY